MTSTARRNVLWPLGWWLAGARWESFSPAGSLAHYATPWAPGTSQSPIQSLVESGAMFKTYELNHHESERYPNLERDSGHLDLLADMARSHARVK